MGIATPADARPRAGTAAENRGRRAGANGRRNGRSRGAQAVRRLHFWLGAVLTANFLLLVVTGLLVQHRESLQLEQRTISRRWLPAAYRPQDPDTEIRADIVLTDLHSGKLFGPRGPLVVDVAAAGWLLMMGSGFTMQLICRNRSRKDS